MLKPICVPCERFMRMEKSGQYFIEGMPLGNDVSPGKADPARWKPYKLWSGDRWYCPDCGARIISGTGMAPLSEHYKSDFADLADRVGANVDSPKTLIVKDC